MKQVLSLLEKGFESSTGITPEFTAFVKRFKKDFSKEVETANAKLISFKVGHFYAYGLIQLETGKKVYFSLPDVRLWDTESPSYFGKLMYREVFKEGKEFQDTTGKNMYVSIKSGMVKDIAKQFSDTFI